jgi:nucleoside-diphosphate-sugar epimerase
MVGWLSRAHLLAMENSNAKGRYILWTETLTMRQSTAIVQRQFPQYPIPTKDLAYV